MQHIVFKAQGARNTTEGATAQEAVKQFLDTHKNRTFSVTEYRDGIFKAVLWVPPGQPNTSYFYKRFTSREEARRFCEQAP